jgi:hypothetical protein
VIHQVRVEGRQFSSLDSGRCEFSSHRPEPLARKAARITKPRWFLPKLEPFWEEVVRDAAAYDATRSLTISGDLNLNASKLGVTEVLAHRGFRDAAPAAFVATIPLRHLLKGGRHIDLGFRSRPSTN